MTGAETFGAVSLVPPLLAIVLAIATRKPILSLFLGIWSGGVIFTTSHGVAQTLSWLVSSIGESAFNAKIMLIVLFLGAGVALVWRLGGANAIADTVTASLDTQRKVGGATWLFGMLWFFDDYSNTAIVGTTMREISDEVRISREKLAYIIDSTAAPVATFGISSWVAYQLSMIREGYSAIGVDPEGGEVPTAFALFLRRIEEKASRFSAGMNPTLPFAVHRSDGTAGYSTLRQYVLSSNFIYIGYVWRNRSLLAPTLLPYGISHGCRTTLIRSGSQPVSSGTLDGGRVVGSGMKSATSRTITNSPRT